MSAVRPVAKPKEVSLMPSAKPQDDLQPAWICQKRSTSPKVLAAYFTSHIIHYRKSLELVVMGSKLRLKMTVPGTGESHSPKGDTV